MYIHTYAHAKRVINLNWKNYKEQKRYLHCCGGSGYLIGFNDYRSTPIDNIFSVPDSCCHEVHEGCGRNILK
jgi:hypothetical protein